MTPPKRKEFWRRPENVPPVRSSVLLTFAAQDGAVQQDYNNTAGGIDHGAIWASRSHRPAAKAPLTRTQRTGTTTTDGRNNETDGDTAGTETRHKATATTTTTMAMVARTS